MAVCCCCFRFSPFLSLFLWNVIHIWSQFIWLSVNNYKTRSTHSFQNGERLFILDLALSISLQSIRSIKNNLTNLNTFYWIPLQNPFRCCCSFIWRNRIQMNLMGFQLTNGSKSLPKATTISGCIIAHVDSVKTHYNKMNKASMRSTERGRETNATLFKHLDLQASRWTIINESIWCSVIFAPFAYNEHLNG